MDHVLADNSTPGLTHQVESNAPESVGSRHADAEQDRRELLWRRWTALVVLLLTTILYFVRLGTRALWASEFRWAEIAREMLLTHNYFWPTINGRVYFDKPLGSYWLILVSAGITGRMDEAAARIPGAIAGVLAVALLIILAHRLYDLRTGVAAGFILATSFGFAFWARTASADIETIAGELAALVIFINHENRTGWWVMPMWFLMAVTSLMKGLLGFVLPITVIGVYSCIGEGWPEFRFRLMHGPLGWRIGWLIERNRWFFNWRTAVAVMLAAVIYFAPFAISYADTGSTKGMYMVYRENIERYFAPFDHRGPIYLYAYVIFGLMAPWSVFLPAALVYAHISAKAASTKLRSDRFVLAFFWTIFIFFTVSGSRRSYYILPILPAASILVARTFMSAEKDLSESCRSLLKGGFGLVLSALVLSLLILVPPRALLPQRYAYLPSLPYRGIFVVCWIFSLSIAVCTFIRYSRTRMLLSVSVLSYLLLFYLFMFVMPAGDQWRGEKSFAKTTRHLIGGNSANLVSFKTQPPVFYLGFAKPVPEYDTLAELESAIQRGQVKWIILRQRDVSILDMQVHEAASEPNYPWDSREHRLNALVLINLER
jgi:4-amino-4-deoxy-L-arabinose transferase-like glycosyltransferase